VRPAGAPIVLVVEDCDEDYDTVVEAAQRTGAPILLQRVYNGDDCLDRLQGRQGAALQPAFVLLDLSTPGLDGRDALRAMRADDRLRSLPVVVLSASANSRDVEACYALGLNAYHVKSVRYDQHLQRVVSILQYWTQAVVLPDVANRWNGEGS